MAAYVIAIGLLFAVLITVWRNVAQGGDLEQYEPGRDYGTFHASALLVVEGNGTQLYDPDLLGTRIAEATGYEEITTQPYGHPPFFPLYFLPFTALPFGVAYGLFVVTGAMALAVTVRRVGIKRSGAVLGIAVLSMAGFWTVLLGQMGLWVSALMLAVFLLLRSDHKVAAGLLLGLLAFKPLYAVGIGVWWLLYPKRYAPAVAGAVLSAATISLLGFLVPEGWANYRALVGDAGGSFVSDVAQSGYSVYEMLLTLFGSTVFAAVLWLLACLVAMAAFRWTLERFHHRLEMAVAAAVVLGLIISPRVGWYDWVLLLVPGVLLWQAYPQLREKLVIGGGWLFLTSALSWTLASSLEKSFGSFFQPASLVLIAVTWWWLRHAAGEPAVSGEPAAEIAVS